MALSAGVALASLARAQSPLASFAGPDQDDEFGAAISGAGNFMSSGYLSGVAVAAPGEDQVRVHEGGTGALLALIAEDGRAGLAIASGDLDNDGHWELVIGAPGGTNAYEGVVRVYDGATGLLVRTHTGGHQANHFGAALATAWLIDLDFMPDLIVGAPDTGPGIGPGDVHAYSGASGALLHTFVGSAAGDEFGSAVAGASGIDTDFYSDIVVGAPGGGYVKAYSGASGATLWTFTGSSSERFGAAVAGDSDLDADGRDDIVVASPLADAGGVDSGRVIAYSGATGAVLWTADGGTAGARLGSSLLAMVDIDGDGHQDVLAGAPLDECAGNDRGSVGLLSGADGSVLFQVFGAVNQGGFGTSVAWVGDFDGDNATEDFAVGAPPTSQQQPGQHVPAGTAHVFSNWCLAPVAYCTAKTNSLGCVPAIAADLNVPSATGAWPFVISASNLLNQKNGLLIYGLSASATPFQGGFLCLAAPRRTPVQSSGGSSGGNDCSGTFAFDFNAHVQSGADPCLQWGTTVFAQYWSRDPASASATNLTNALRFTICR